MITIPDVETMTRIALRILTEQLEAQRGSDDIMNDCEVPVQHGSLPIVDARTTPGLLNLNPIIISAPCERPQQLVVSDLDNAWPTFTLLQDDLRQLSHADLIRRLLEPAMKALANDVIHNRLPAFVNIPTAPAPSSHVAFDLDPNHGTGLRGFMTTVLTKTGTDTILRFDVLLQVSQRHQAAPDGGIEK